MGNIAMYMNPKNPPAFSRSAQPLQPNYQDEITDEQAAQISKAIDPDGTRAADRKPLYNPGW